MYLTNRFMAASKVLGEETIAGGQNGNNNNGGGGNGGQRGSGESDD